MAMTMALSRHKCLRFAATGLSLAGLVGMLSCGEGTAPQDGPEDPSLEVGPAIVSDPVSPASPTALVGASAVLAPGVAYVSLPPGTYPHGLTMTIANRRTTDGLTTALVAGGLD